MSIRHNATRPKRFPVFPGLGTAAGSLFTHSFVGYGKNDSVKHIQKKINWEPQIRHMAMLSETEKSTLVIPFKHRLKKGSEKESWWSVVLALKVDPVSGDWQPVDLTRFKALIFDARFIPGVGSDHKPTFLKLRLEDDSRSSSSPSKHQSTDWHPKAQNLPGTFKRIKIQLEDFDWSRKAWIQNSGPVKRQRIYQIVFGQDSEVPPVQGVIEIKNISFV